MIVKKENLNKKKEFNCKEKKNKKKGFINIFMSFLLIFIFQISILLVRESVIYKKNIISYEKDLKFDYRLEVYYLMLNLKYTNEELDQIVMTPYGSFNEYKLINKEDFLKDFTQKIDYLIILDKENRDNKTFFILKGYKDSKIRKEYIIHEKAK